MTQDQNAIQIVQTRPPDATALAPMTTAPAAVYPSAETTSSWVEFYTIDAIKPLFPDRGNHPNLHVTAEIWTLIMNHIANIGVYYKACRAAGISLRYFEKMREAWPVLDDLTQDAMAVYRQKLIEIVHERAVNGVEEEVYYQGRPCGSVRHYSDQLLAMLIKRHLPEFRDHSTADVNVNGGVLVVHQPAQSREEWLAERRKAEAIPAEVVKRDGQ
jgi:hypothetical protein